MCKVQATCTEEPARRRVRQTAGLRKRVTELIFPTPRQQVLLLLDPAKPAAASHWTGRGKPNGRDEPTNAPWPEQLVPARVLKFTRTRGMG